jgi:peptide deformylase
VSLRLRVFGDPVLKQPSVRVAPETDVSGLIYEMKEVLAKATGLGLAAQQVGSTHRVAIVTFGGKSFAAINLEILERSKANTLSTHEGCLSVRKDGRLFRMNVKRSQRVLARWEDENRQVHTQRLGGLDAIVAQHEAEHLDGLCIVDRLAPPQLERLKEVA